MDPALQINWYNVQIANMNIYTLYENIIKYYSTTILAQKFIKTFIL